MGEARPPQALTSTPAAPSRTLLQRHLLLCTHQLSPLCWIQSINIQNASISPILKKTTSLDPNIPLWLLHADAPVSVFTLASLFLSWPHHFLSIPASSSARALSLFTSYMPLVSHGFQYHLFFSLKFLPQTLNFPFISKHLFDISFGCLTSQN